MMFFQYPSVQPIIAQAPPEPAANGEESFDLMTTAFMATSGLLLIAVIGLVVYGKLQIDKLNKAIKFEEYRTKDLQKRLKLALKTIQKMETNPDLVHSREFNLDYLRLRMDEEVFHYAIVNQVKIRVKDLISVALRPNTANHQVGIAATGRQVDETFDVTYETEAHGKRVQGVLFRIQIKLTKLPTQSTSTTISQIIDCIEKFLSPNEDHDNWQPTIQGRVARMDWDQKAKPTPLLVLEQSGEGVNVSFRTNPNRRAGGAEDELAPAPPPPPTRGRSQGKPQRPPSGAKRPASPQRPPARPSSGSTGGASKGTPRRPNPTAKRNPPRK
ncbi:hypothetical protein K4A83_19035 [Spirulina subsalsa FACHB-351]|uniref:Uncharacterized protein n=2 Tax=Spirulina subsalsa TaxID=54311 RepID=A0ABT3LB59_9CYAN|nr:hypothetical protein [Spirulina subsalsa]MCW6038352.1 hypothetical protein [Spirulina subsalsa FACHB-351]